MFLSIKKRIENTLDATIRNFLSYMLKNKEEFSNQLCCDYSEDERNEFIYNCALNTIDEYILNKEYTILLSISTLSIIRLFKENFMLRMFERNKLCINVGKTTMEIIEEFSCLKDNLSDVQKNNIMKNLASTIN